MKHETFEILGKFKKEHFSIKKFCEVQLNKISNINTIISNVLRFQLEYHSFS